MKINYILSDTTKSATSEALKQVVKKAEENLFDNFVVIVPETKSIIIEKELLALSKNGAFANIYVYSFVRLISRLGFVAPEKIVSKQTAVMMLRKIIFDNMQNLKCYQKAAKTIGFAEKIYDTIQQFKSSNITFEDLKEKISNCSNSLKAKLEDILLLFEAYENALSGKFFDDCDKLNLLNEFSKNNDFAKNAEFFVVGFDNITYEMASVLKNLSANAKEITFSAVYFNEKRKDKHIQNNELYNKLKHISDELKLPYVPKFVSSKMSGDFEKIKNNLFVLGQKFDSNGAVCVFEANSKKQEIDFLANQILLEVQKGKKFKDVGILVCSLDDTVDLIEKCFKAYEIPYFVNKDYDVSKHALIGFIQAVFELKRTHLSSEKVLKFLSSDFVSTKHYALFENYVNERGLNYNAFLNDLNKDDFNDEFLFNKVNEILTKFQTFYGAFDQIVSSAKTIGDYVKAIDFVLDYFAVASKLEDIALFEKENGLDVESEITLVILRKCQEFNATLTNFMGETKVTLDEFLQIYLSGFGTIKLNLSPVSIDAVVVQNNTDGFFDVKTMFVVGCEDGKFPTKIQDSGIILDSELLETKELIGKTVEPSVKDINDRELFRAYESLLEPKEKLFVSFSKIGVDGTACKPSRMVLRLLSLFGESVKLNKYQRFENPIKTGFEFKFAKNINKYLKGEYLFDELNDEFNVLKNQISKPFEKHLNEIDYGEKKFVLSNVTNLYFAKNKTSISQLEKYFTCPYLFFASYGLRLKENKKAKLSSIDIGSILHRVAELFVGEISEFEKLDEVVFDEKVEHLCKLVYEEYKVNEKQNKALIEFISAESKRLCKHLFYEQENSSFKNKLNEFSFDGENAVKIQIDENTVIAIEGKIDRVDEWGNYIRIIDYKTGDIKNNLDAIYYGKKIQLVSYLLATDNFKYKKVAGLFYFPIHSDFVKNDKKIKDIYKLQGFLIDDAEVLKHMDNTVSFENSESHLIPLKIKTNKEMIKTNTFEISKARQKNYLSENEFADLKLYNQEICKTAIQEILSGYVAPSPAKFSADDSPCKWCELNGVCGVSKAKFSDGRLCADDVSIESFKINEGESDG